MERSRITYRIAPEDAGLGLRELAARLAGEAGAIAAARGGAWLDGRRVSDAAAPAPAGAELTLRFPPADGYTDVTITAEDLAYEDAWLIAVHKRAGWYVGATPWDAQGNVLAALGRYLTSRDGAAPPLHLAHQLDRDTSGLLLVSKAPAANAALQAAFTTGEVVKTYLGLCAGRPPWSAIDLRTGHGRAAGGRWRIYPLEAVGQALPEGGGRVREAHSSFRVARTLGDAALVIAVPHTGRTHQIRLHLAHLGHPLLGDTRYGGPPGYAGQPLPGHLLHAAELRLRHPITGAMLALASPPPPLFEAFL
ncbi:MAG: RluA family pseudouridine synthase [Oscillochloridaceae bacterium]|nr:RluA family pseudouridine synthase [Chloroflexaceae bacterium]MDW8390982.1 RluA family pseudouridine synthase [Oscillochloridaceae bacterium]